MKSNLDNCHFICCTNAKMNITEEKQKNGNTVSETQS